MLTYQDFLKNRENNLEKFLLEVVNQHRASTEYREAEIAEQYDRQKNVTMRKFQKFLYTMTGQKVPDVVSANHKLCSNYFHRLTTQLVQYLLGNGITFAEKGIKEKLGESFDTMLQKAGRYALIGGVSFGFWDYDNLKVYKLTEFAPLYDEEDGSLKAGIRFWRLAQNKPLRMTLYEIDGYTEYTHRQDQPIEILKKKRPYKLIVKSTEADGAEIYGGENYPNFPIVPLYANDYHQSELTGMRANIDAYDFIKSGFANDLDGHLLYWVIQNAGGMDDVDIARMIERIKFLGAAVVNDEGGVEGKEINIPYEARNSYLDRIDSDLYKDFGALKLEQISGHTTIPEIEAAYVPLDSHADDFEYPCITFIQGILALQGIKSTPQFKRNRISNRAEETNMILQSASYLDDETILKHLPFLTNDEVDIIKQRKEKEEAERYKLIEQSPENEDDELEDEKDEETENQDIQRDEKSRRKNGKIA